MKNKITILFLILIIASCYESKKEKESDLEVDIAISLIDSIVSNETQKDQKENNKISDFTTEKKDSTITIYYPTGEARYVQSYDIWGDLTAEWINYYKNGQIKQKGYYSNGQASGMWKYYNEDGTLQKKEFIELDTNCVRFVALWDSETIAQKIGKSKRWVFRNYTVDVWDRNTSNNKKKKVTQLRASSYAEILDFNEDHYLVKAPMDGKIGWINKSHVKTISIKNKLTRKLCD